MLRHTFFIISKLSREGSENWEMMTSFFSGGSLNLGHGGHGGRKGQKTGRKW